MGFHPIVLPRSGKNYIFLQVALPFLVAGFGTVGAGMVLDVVQVQFSYCGLLSVEHATS